MKADKLWQYLLSNRKAFGLQIFQVLCNKLIQFVKNIYPAKKLTEFAVKSRGSKCCFGMI